MADNGDAENKPAGQVSTAESNSSSEKPEPSEGKTNATDTQQAKNSAAKESETIKTVNRDKPAAKKSNQSSKKSDKGSKKSVGSECDKSDTSTSEQENSPMQSKDTTVPNTNQDSAREENVSNNSPDHAEESDEDGKFYGQRITNV